MIEISVGLPCYNGENIGWLALEGLCRQEGVDFQWELIVAEEDHVGMLGRDFFDGYRNRLKKVGCVKVKYLSYGKWVQLIQKWRDIGNEVDTNSKCMLLQDVDDYPRKDRLAKSYKYISEGFHWVEFKKGYFYNFNKVIRYNGRSKTNLDIAIHSNFVRDIPMTNRNKGVHKHLFNSVKKKARMIKRKTIACDGKGSLYTDGYNNISKRRQRFYSQVRPPFINDLKTIADIGIPDEIVERLKEMRCQQR